MSERGGELVDEWVVDRIRKAGCHGKLADRRISGRADVRVDESVGEQLSARRGVGRGGEERVHCQAC